MIFAIEEINNSSSLLPNTSIGYKVFDSCGSTLPSMRAVMGLMNGQERSLGKTCSSQSSVHAIIGASESSSTIVMLQISGIFENNIPTIRNVSFYHETELTWLLFIVKEVTLPVEGDVTQYFLIKMSEVLVISTVPDTLYDLTAAFTKL